MFCSNCGAKVSDGAKFCDKCGTPLNATGNSTATVSGKRDKQKEFTVSVFRDKQFNLIDAKVNVLIDGMEKGSLMSGEEIHIPVSTGIHELMVAIKQIIGGRKTAETINVNQDLNYFISFNRITGGISLKQIR